MNLTLSEARTLPSNIDVDEIVMKAMNVAFALIAVNFEDAGYPITGDVSPEAELQINDVFESFVRMLALNNPDIAKLNEEE